MLRKFFHYISIRSETEDFQTIHRAIEKDMVFRGTNLWILGFATVIASVGLNINSAAVIIGAMLISPLMGPINAIGYGIATYDFPLFSRALKNLAFAIFASLFASTLYFLLTPLSSAHSEMLARTSPSIYDVLIALAGGLAGVLAISSKLKGNVIPGVAIATALMPPLCTAGYGLATLQMPYFIGAFYLFTINVVFISVSSIITSKFLQFPIKGIPDRNRVRHINTIITSIIILFLVPSIYLGIRMVKKDKFTENAKRFINTVGIVEGSYLLNNQIIPEKDSIMLIYGGNTINDSLKKMIISKTTGYNLSGVKIGFLQGFSFEGINKNISEAEKLRAEINRLSVVIKNKEKQLDSIRENNDRGKHILNEIRNFYPQIEACSFTENYASVTGPGQDKMILFTVSREIARNDRTKIAGWLKQKLNTNKIKVYYER